MLIHAALAAQAILMQPSQEIQKTLFELALTRGVYPGAVGVMVIAGSWLGVDFFGPHALLVGH